MKENSSNYIDTKVNKLLSKEFFMLKDNSCFGTHGQLSVLLRNIKFYFDIKPKNKECADVILQVILCNIKQLIDLCNLGGKNQNLPSFLGLEKNTWQYYKSIKTPTKTKQLYLEMAVGEDLLIESYKKLIISLEKSKSEKLQKIIEESKQCLEFINKQMQ